MKVLSVFGTRPEAIKMCPLIKEMDKHEEIQNVVCLTGQHKEMLQQVIDIFGIEVAYNLNIMRPQQTLTTITTSVLERLESVLMQEKPDIVLVHGDTSTSFAAALAAFYQQIPVGHVEAGLRTYDKYSPFPEEMNRSLTGKIAELHFAPTENNRKNLANENIHKNVFVTGNTVIDAFHTTVKDGYVYKDKGIRDIDFSGKRCILMTAHRRENLGEPLRNICRAVRQIVEKFSDVEVVYPVHMNPAVRNTAEEILKNIKDNPNLEKGAIILLHNAGAHTVEALELIIPVLKAMGYGFGRISDLLKEVPEYNCGLKQFEKSRKI